MSSVRLRSGPIGLTPRLDAVAGGISTKSDDSSWERLGSLIPFPALKVSFVSPSPSVADG